MCMHDYYYTHGHTEFTNHSAMNLEKLCSYKERWPLADKGEDKYISLVWNPTVCECACMITLQKCKVISTLAGLPQLHLFRGFYSVHIRVISTLPRYSQL